MLLALRTILFKVWPSCTARCMIRGSDDVSASNRAPDTFLTPYLSRPPPSPRRDSDSLLVSHRTCPSFPSSHVCTFCVVDTEPVNVRLEALGVFDLLVMHRLLFITPHGAYGGFRDRLHSYISRKCKGDLTLAHTSPSPHPPTIITTPPMVVSSCTSRTRTSRLAS